MTAKGEVSGATLANTTDTFAVDAEGNVTAADVTAADVTAADVTASGEVKGATFGNTAGTFSVNAAGNVIAADFTAGNVKVNGTTNTVTGLSNTEWDESTIQSVTNDTERTGAAAYAATQGQLYDVYNAAVEDAKGTQYTAGDGIAIGTGDTPVISVNYGDGLELGEAVEDGTEPLQVKENKSKGIEVTDAGVGIKLAESGSNLTFDGNGGLRLADTLTGLTSINAGSGSFTSMSIGTGTSTISIANGTISGLADITESSGGDVAVNKTYVDNLFDDLVDNIPTVEGTEYTQGNGVSITKGAGEDDPSTISVNAGDGLTFADSVESDGTRKLIVNAGKGLDINADGSVEVKTGDGLIADTDGVNLVVDDTNLQIDGTKGLGLKSDITVTSATADTFAIADSSVALSSSGLTVSDTTSLTATDGLKATKATIGSISIAGNAITGVTTDDQEGTSAVSVDYLKGYVTDNATYMAGNGLKLENKTFSVQSADNSLSVTGDGVAVNIADSSNLTVGDNGVDLKDAITLNKVTATSGFYVANNGPQLTTDGLTIGDTILSSDLLYIDGDHPVTIADGTITGLVNPDGTDTSAAVNVGYLNQYFNEENGLAVLYDSKDRDSITLNGTTISGLKATDSLTADSTYAATVGQVWSVDHKAGTLTWTSDNFLTNDMDLTAAASALDKAIGDLDFSGNTVLGNAEEKYTDVTSALDDLNSVVGDMVFADTDHITNTKTVTEALTTLDDTIGALHFTSGYVLGDSQDNVTSALDKLNTVIGTGDFTGTTYLQYVQFQSDSITGALTTLDGAISGVRSDLTTLQGDVKGLTDRVTALENNNGTGTQSETGTADATMESKAAATAESASAESTVSTSTESVATESLAIAEVSSISMQPKVMSATPMTLNMSPVSNGPTGDTSDDDGSRNPDKWGNITSEEGKTTIDGNLTVNGDTTMNGSLDMTGHTITGVADGKVSADSTESVNGSQLYETNQRVAANEQNIGILGSAVNKLGDRIERVGAGAAALAALHPLDFDPDNKLDFAAGFGNYRGASAVAVGAFYRPSENVMFSVGGAFGGGEDMVNAGVSFKVGAGSGSATTSRTAMAKSLKSMQEVVASQDAQLAQQREQIDKLTAMVELLMEQNGQAQPKDSDAQAGQPQQ